MDTLSVTPSNINANDGLGVKPSHDNIYTKLSPSKSRAVKNCPLNGVSLN